MIGYRVSTGHNYLSAYFNYGKTCSLSYINTTSISSVVPDWTSLPLRDLSQNHIHNVSCLECINVPCSLRASVDKCCLLKLYSKCDAISIAISC